MLIPPKEEFDYNEANENMMMNNPNRRGQNPFASSQKGKDATSKSGLTGTMGRSIGTYNN
jgi:hypothetical protein